MACIAVALMSGALSSGSSRLILLRSLGVGVQEGDQGAISRRSQVIVVDFQKSFSGHRSGRSEDIPVNFRGAGCIHSLGAPRGREEGSERFTWKVSAMVFRG